MVFIEKSIGSVQYYSSTPRSTEQLRPQTGALQKWIAQARVVSLEHPKLGTHPPRLLTHADGMNYFFMPLVSDSITVL
jgi:hypothetical protein